MKAFVVIAFVVGACAGPPKPTVSGADLYARLATFSQTGRVELPGSNGKPVSVQVGQILVTEDARAMFAVDTLVAGCTGQPVEESELCNLASYKETRFRVYNDEPVHLANTTEEDEEAELDFRVKVALVLGALAIPMTYGIATCEFDDCKAVFGVGIGLDLLLVLVLFTGFG